MRNLLLQLGIQGNSLLLRLIDGSLEVSEFLLQRLQQRRELILVDIRKMPRLLFENLGGERFELLFQELDLRLPVLFHFRLVLFELLFQNGKRLLQSIAFSLESPCLSVLLLLRELQFVGKLIPEPFEQCPGFFRVSFAQVLKFPLMRTGNQFPLMLRLFFQRFQRGKRLRRGDTAGFRLRFDRFRLGKTRFQSIRSPLSRATLPA